MSHIKAWPSLFKKTKTGAIEQWDIRVDANTIFIRYGHIDGAIQETSDTIKEGKNLGKKTETSPEQQALSEAQSKWEKQVKKGYVQSLEDAKAGKNDLGGIAPMLAHKYHEHAGKVIWPAFVQPKLDGTRWCSHSTQAVPEIHPA